MRILKERSGVEDSIEIVHLRKDGTIVSKITLPKDKGLFHRILVALGLKHDTMTVSGFSSITAFMGNLTPPAAFIYVGIGTGTTPSTVTDTQLQTPLKIKAATMSQVTTTYTNDTLQAVVTFSNALDGLTGTTVAVTEVVLANGTVNGTALIALHQTYTPSDTMNWNQGDQLQVTVKMQSKQG